MLDIIICDEEGSNRDNVVEIVKDVCSNHDLDHAIHIYKEYNEDFMYNIAPDGKKIYILNMDMPKGCGMDVARIIHKTNMESIIIFLMESDKFSRFILKKNILCSSFIHKYENLKLELTESLEEAFHFFLNNKIIRITDSGITYHIRLNSILYITRDSCDRRTVIKCNRNEYRLKMNLSTVKDLFGDGFIQTHRSCYVNRSRVSMINHKNKLITFDNGLTIDLLSNTYRKELES